MKILMVHPHDLFSSAEPWTIRIVKLAEQLAKKGHQVQIAYFPLMDRAECFLGSVPVIPFVRAITPDALIRNTKKLCALSRKTDLVHFQKSHFYAALPTVLAAYWSGKPLHYDWDDWEEKIFHASLHKKTLAVVATGASFWMMERCLPFLADSVSVASEKLKALAIQRGASVKRVSLVPVGADLDLFYAGGKGTQDIRKKYNVNGELLVLYHGQLNSCQYVKLFLQAIKIISKGPAALRLKFMILGDGSERERLEEFSETLGIGEMVVFAGFVLHTDIPRYIAAADICVAPFDDNEVTRCKSPLKIVEYMASGKPVVASDVGEVRNMLEGAGLLVRPNSADEIAKGILKLANDKKLRDALSLVARKKAETIYNWRFSAEKLEESYQCAFYDSERL